MLKLKNIKKSYKTDTFTQNALEDVSLTFRKSEFVAILGPSGSGKTTLLNIIGGLDRYDSGDLIINNKSTKKFKDTEWDSYRNNCVGFIFQSYNLISHISILANVEMGMTLSGVSKKERRKKAIEVLERVGLKDHINKKPNQLSGGQMQRVAIARALANDPDIILADEPTGALDSKTSVQIMDLIKEISKDKLVIMVTHNSDLANEYASRIIELKDGKIINDSNPIKKDDVEHEYKIKKTAMNFLTALSLSFNNIKTKKGRTILTAFASSIGIIGIAIILSLSNGFDKQIDKFETDTLSNFPITISRQATEMTEDDLNQFYESSKSDNFYPDTNLIYPYDTQATMKIHENLFTEDYIKYINNIDKNDIVGISYLRILNMNLLVKNDNVKYITSSTLGFASLPKEKEHNDFLTSGYDLLYGSLPKEKTDLVVAVDMKNRLEKSIIEALGLDSSKEIEFKDIIGKEFKIILNDEFYKEMNGFYMPNMDLESLYNNENAITLKITGVVRGKEDNTLANISSMMSMNVTAGSILYSNDLAEYIIEQNSDSSIVKTQQTANYNVMSGKQFEDETTKEDILIYLGAKDIPYMINIFPVDFDSKEEIVSYLDKYNENLSDEDKVIYTDVAATVVSLSGNIMDAITVVLVAFSAISLVVSCIMIGIITYISVLERTKEIGILRSLGARKKDVSRVFNAETFIVGLTSGLIGVIIARLALFPINTFLENLTDLKNVAQMNPLHILLLIVVSVILTLIGGWLPAIMASKKNPVEALRTE